MLNIFLGFHQANNDIGLGTIKLYHRYLSRIIPTWLEVKGSGDILTKMTESEKSILLRYFKRHEIIPLLQNSQMDSAISNRIISNYKFMQKMVNHLLKFMEKNGFREININLEGVSYENKERFTYFINMITEKFHKEKYSVIVSIPAKSENNRDLTWSGAYDYQKMGEIVDKVIIMAYDFHWPGGPPGAIAPLDWVKDVVDFAIIEIPLKKLYIAFGFYGYDWIMDSNKNARGLIFKQVQRLAKEHESNIEWDQESQSPYLKYHAKNEKHEVWFENKESLSRKFKLVSDYQLAGAAAWRLGQEDPGIWQLFKRVKKR